MNCKGNRRVAMTKRMLKNSLLELLQTETIQKVSVRALCERADLNRSTFYKYYTSVCDLLRDMERDLIVEIDKDLNLKAGPSSNTDQLAHILSFVKDHLELCRTLIDSNADPGFLERLLRHPAILERLETNRAVDSVERAYAKEFLLYGAYRVIEQWICKACAEPPEKMAKIIMGLAERLCEPPAQPPPFLEKTSPARRTDVL